MPVQQAAVPTCLNAGRSSAILPAPKASPCTQPQSPKSSEVLPNVKGADAALRAATLLWTAPPFDGARTRVGSPQTAKSDRLLILDDEAA